MDLIGKQLPSVSAADNGKVLGVENGAWKPVAGGSGSVNPVIVNVSLTSKTEGTWTGATWDDLLNAFNHNVAGFIIGDDQNCVQMWLNYKEILNGDITLLTFMLIGGTTTYYSFESDGTFTLTTARPMSSHK